LSRLRDTIVKKHSRILDAAHATAKGLYSAQATDERTMREFDQVCVSRVTPIRPVKRTAMAEAAVLAVRPGTKTLPVAMLKEL
jgi:DNA-binding transcriptional regulator YiaG